ncbi:MAG: S8 family serine peptidase [bacterium]|nr:S8 family serine peptidase [bacterium]
MINMLSLDFDLQNVDKKTLPYGYPASNSEILRLTMFREVAMKLSLLLRLVFVFFASVAFAIPQYTPNRVWLRITPAFSENTPQLEDGTILAPVGNPKIDEILTRYNVTALLPLIPHDPISKRNRYFYEYNLYRDYKIVIDPKQTKLSREEDLWALAAELKLSNAVDDASPIPFRTVSYQPNDWALNGQNSWGIDSCHGKQAWDLQRGDSTILAVTIDTGVNFLHPDLVQNIQINSAEDIDHDDQFTTADNNGIDEDNNGYIDDVIGYDFVSYTLTDETPAVGEEYGPRDNSPGDVHGHGTHVIGSIAARTDNSLGVSAASFNVKTICLRAGFAWLSGTTLRGSGTDEDFVPAIHYAVNRGARIISISFGGSGTFQPYQDEINYARANNCLMFAAAGNNNSQTMSYPAAYTNMLAVAALGTGNVRASFSNYGTWVDISAPGVSIWSTMANNTYHANDYLAWSGTSMASPTAASVAALVLSRRPGMTDDELESYLLTTAHNIDAENPTYVGRLGVGIIDAYAAVLAVPTSEIALQTGNGGESWPIGSSQSIQWSTYSPITAFRIELNRNYPSANWENLYTGTLASNSYNWMVTGPTTTTARFRILNIEDLTQGDTSNANFTIYSPAILSVVPNPIVQTIVTGDTLRTVVTLTNTGGSALTATLPDTGTTVAYRRSTDVGGPTFNWIDATSGSIGISGDDQLGGPYTLPFNFPFYGGQFNQVWMCTNGWLSLTATNDSSYSNSPLPSNAHNAFLAVFWDDLLVQSPGVMYVFMDEANGRAVFSWDGIRRYASGTSLNFQAILYADGRVLYQYGTMSGTLNSATIGMQNETRTRHLTVLHNTTVPANHAILFQQTIPFNIPSQTTFSIPAGGSTNLSIFWDARNRAVGAQFVGSLDFTGNALNMPLSVPLTMNVIQPIIPAVPEQLAITVVDGVTRRLDWQAVRTDNFGELLIQPPTYRVEESSTPEVTDSWTALTTQSDTTTTITVMEVPYRYYRVIAVLGDATDYVGNGTIQQAFRRTAIYRFAPAEPIHLVTEPKK